MFFIDNDQSQIGKRGEQRRSGSHHHLHLATFRSFELVITFSLGKSGIQNRHPVSKSGIEAHHRLISQRNLRNQHNCLFSLTDHPTDHLNINFRLPTSGYAIKQICSVMSLTVIFPECVDCLLLFWCMCKWTEIFFLVVYRITEILFFLNLQYSLLFQRTNDRKCDI